MRFFVTGGAGYVGSHFVKAALDTNHNHTCLVFDTLERGHREAIPKNVELVIGNVLETQKLEKTIEKFGPDVVLHYAAYALVPESVADPEKYYRNNVGGVESILTALKNIAEKSGKKIPLVFSSTCAVFGTPKKLPMAEGDPKKPESPYGESKLRAETLIADFVRNTQIPAIALRYFNACGADASGDIGEAHDPETHLIPNILLAAMAGKKITIFGKDYPTRDGTCVRDYIHVTDLALSHLRAAEFLLDKKTKVQFYTVHVGSGDGYTNLEVVQAAERVLPKDKKLNLEFAPRRPGDPPELYADTSYAKQLLQFTPTHSGIDNIVATAWKWHSNHPKGF